jgi:hypothetical protein
MSSLTIRNLERSAELDRKAMSAVRGGAGFGSPEVQVYVPININQANNLAQTTSVLNNSTIGVGGSALSGLNISPELWAVNAVSLPKMSGQFA